MEVFRRSFEFRESTQEVSSFFVAWMLGLHENLAVPLYDEGVVRPDVHALFWDAPTRGVSGDAVLW